MTAREEIQNRINDMITGFDFLKSKEALNNKRKLREISEYLLKNENNFIFLESYLKKIEDQLIKSNPLSPPEWVGAVAGTVLIISGIASLGGLFFGTALLVGITTSLLASMGIVLGALLVVIPVLIVVPLLITCIVAGLCCLPSICINLFTRKQKTERLLENAQNQIGNIKIDWLDYGQQFVPQNEEPNAQNIIKNAYHHYPKPVQKGILEKLCLFKKTNSQLPKPIQLEIIAQYLGNT